MSAETEYLRECPVAHDAKPKQRRTNAHWWPDQLPLGLLRRLFCQTTSGRSPQGMPL